MAIYKWMGTTDGTWSTAGNWSPTGPPGTGDTALIPADASVNIDGSDETGTPIDKLIIEEGCSINTGSAGTPLQLSLNGETNATVQIAGTGTQYIQITDAHEIEVTEAGGSPGSGRYALNLLSAAGTDPDDCPLTIVCGNGESVGLGTRTGTDSDDSAEFESIKITGGDIYIGENVTEAGGATAPDLNISGGDVECNSALGTVEVKGGTLRQNNGAIATANISGTLYANDTSPLTNTTTIRAGGTLDLSEDLAAKTTGVIVLQNGATLNDPNGVLANATEIDFEDCGPQDCTLDLGNDFTLTKSAI